MVGVGLFQPSALCVIIPLTPAK